MNKYQDSINRLTEVIESPYIEDLKELVVAFEKAVEGDRSPLNLLINSEKVKRDKYPISCQYSLKNKFDICSSCKKISTCLVPSEKGS